MRVFLDSETELFAPGRMLPPLVCLQVYAKPNEPRIFRVDEGAREVIENLLPSAEFVLHGAHYDFGVICAEWPDLAPLVFDAYDEGRVQCTEIRDQLHEISHGRHQANNPTKGGRGYSYAACVLDRLGRAIEKGDSTWRLRFGELRDTPVEEWPEEAIAYALDDVTYLAELWQWQEENTPPEVFVDQYRQVRGDFWLGLSSAWGAMPDSRKVDALETFIRSEIKEHAEVLQRVGLLAPRSAKECRQFEALGRPADFKVSPGKKKDKRTGNITEASGWKRSTKIAAQLAEIVDPNWPRTDPTKMVEANREKFPSGQISLAAEHCEVAPRLCDETCGCLPSKAPGEPCRPGMNPCAHHVLESFGKYTSLATVLSKDVALLRRGSVHTSYGLADTTRATSFDPNVQNFKTGQYGPKEGPWFGIRECFVPRKSYIYVSADYSKLELCTFAQTCLDLFGFSRLAELLNSGIDPLLDAAAQMLFIPYDEAVARKKIEDAENRGKGPVNNARQTGKVMLYGFPGGLGADAFVEYAWGNYRVRVSKEEAKRLKQTWFQVLPEARMFLDYVSRCCEKGPATLTLPRSGLVRGGLRYTQFANTWFQGPGAVIGKASGWEVAKRCYVARHRSPLFGSRQVFFVHDEHVLETPESIASEAGEELTRVMESTARLFLPGVTIEAPAAIHRVWSKSIKPKRDANGRLVCSEIKS